MEYCPICNCPLFNGYCQFCDKDVNLDDPALLPETDEIEGLPGFSDQETIDSVLKDHWI